tara:strand:- start:125 stop:376 length:252 start_codon:yes stop_codon:yes gene_type:complete
MSEEIKYIRERVDGIAETLARNTVVLEKNTESLKEHMRRTDLLETQMETALWPIRIAQILVWVGGVVMFGATLYYYWNQVVRP